jgi:hypothetical protein
VTRPDASHPVALPRGLRFAASVCLVLSAFTGFFSLIEYLGLGQLDAVRDPVAVSFVGDPILDQHITRARLDALKPQQGSRIFFLGALAVACSLSFVSAARLLRPEGLSLERMRRMLVGATLAVALLRTIDGAQATVVARYSTDALRTLPEFQEPTAAVFLELLGWQVPVTIGFTVLIAGAFVLLGQYFQSERVRQAISARAGRPAEEE